MYYKLKIGPPRFSCGLRRFPGLAISIRLLCQRREVKCGAAVAELKPRRLVLSVP